MITTDRRRTWGRSKTAARGSSWDSNPAEQSHLSNLGSLWHNTFDKRWPQEAPMPLFHTGFSFLLGLGFCVTEWTGSAGHSYFSSTTKVWTSCLGKQFWKQLQCLSSVHLDFYSFNINLSCSIWSVAICHCLPSDGLRCFFSILELEKTWQHQLLIPGTTAAPPRCISCWPAETPQLCAPIGLHQ